MTSIQTVVAVVSVKYQNKRKGESVVWLFRYIGLVECCSQRPQTYIYIHCVFKLFSRKLAELHAETNRLSYSLLSCAKIMKC